jgi:cellulose synthase/poly-beta-1,6-N-acetylglucosamine synthase-like glycosyltransferase
MSWKRLVINGILLFCELMLITYLIPGNIVWISLAIGAAAASYFLLMARKAGKSRVMEMARSINLLPILSFILPFIFGWLTIHLGYISLVLAILLTSLAIEFFSNFLALPLSMYHKYLEEKLARAKLSYWPSVSIIVPARNEEKVIERCIESLLEIDYPKKEIIVVDDGSSDRTYWLAKKYSKKGVKVIRRRRAGGKSVALNTGMLLAKGEIIVTCDADSIISRAALKAIVKRFQDPTVTAVAGNVKVLNRTNLVTKCQALEYIVNENIYRRVFDIFGVVPVVPGPLAAFRRKALREIGFYDKDTLTEDFDITIKILKAGKVVQALSNAIVYTEAPATWRDFYRQRLRWNRGTFQTLRKHWNVLKHSRFGFVHTLTFPYVLLSMLFIPFASIFTIISLIYAVLSGYALQVLYVMAGFMLLQATYSLLAIQMDEEDLKLIVFSPLFVVGYKEIRNFIKIKSFLDVFLLKKEMKWGRIRRVGG